MSGFPRINYEKDVDPWVKKNPSGNYKEFLKATKSPVSDWSFRKRRAKILDLPLSPSMQDGYRQEMAPNGVKRAYRTRVRSANLYSTVFSMPVQELKGKNGFEAMNILVGALNEHFKANMQMVQVEVMGSGSPMFELRKYQ